MLQEPEAQEGCCCHGAVCWLRQGRTDGAGWLLAALCDTAGMSTASCSDARCFACSMSVMARVLEHSLHAIMSRTCTRSLSAASPSTHMLRMTSERGLIMP